MTATIRLTAGLGRQAPGSCEGVEAVARELVWRDIIPDIAGLCALGQRSRIKLLSCAAREHVAESPPFAEEHARRAALPGERGRRLAVVADVELVRQERALALARESEPTASSASR